MHHDDRIDRCNSLTNMDPTTTSNNNNHNNS